VLAAYAHALETGRAREAYDLLSEEAKKSMPFEAFERMANFATKAGVEGKSQFRIHTPLIRMTKAEIIRAGHALGVDFSLTWSCYEPASDGRACGRCDSCALRKKGFVEAGSTDPLLYATYPPSTDNRPSGI